jgi:hypothetical protein
MKKNLPRILLVCLAFYATPGTAWSQSINFGKSYINVTKGVSGGTVEQFDTLEIRASFVVRSGMYDSCGYFDVIPAGTSYIPGTIRVLTNEGVIYKQFTDGPNDDAGWITGSNIRINLGYVPSDAPATATRRGRIRNAYVTGTTGPYHKPSFYRGTCIMIASYRIRVLTPIGGTVSTGGGSFTYKPSGGPLAFFTLPTNTIAVYTNYGICSNTVGANSLGTETNGTFGSGKPRNRGTSLNVPSGYTFDVFTTGGPQDYYYGIANNTSAAGNYTTSNAWPKPDGGNHRVFSVWDIIGDHTGAADPFLGNPAADTVANSNAGYMLVINAAYRIDSAFKHTITGLCPNTFYEISLWMRNVCSKCGCDSNGTGAGSGSSSYIPPVYDLTDSSGVRPNITFELDGVDYYTTGNLQYTGRWVKKGFTFLTGMNQNSFTLKLKNNAPGGGGNDWAIDDISVATCTPNLDMKPTPNVNVCYGNSVDMSCLVSCFFPNYIYWEWEKSTNNGVTWVSTGQSGVATGPNAPVKVGNNWEYTAGYPTFLGDSTQHNAIYRIRIASTAGNLDSANCSFTASSTIRVWVNNCMNVLSTELLSFKGKNEGGYGHLQWTTAKESSTTQYEIEKSSDGVHFSKIGTQAGTGGADGGGQYHFTDPEILKGTAYYRVRLVDGDSYKYSQIITLNAGLLKFEIKSLVNPFDNNITFDVVTPDDKQVVINVLDGFGRKVKMQTQALHTGFNHVVVNGLSGLSNGVYILQLEADGQVLNKKIMKTKR